MLLPFLFYMPWLLFHHYVVISYDTINQRNPGTVDDHTVDIDESFLELQRWCPLVCLWKKMQMLVLKRESVDVIRLS